MGADLLLTAEDLLAGAEVVHDVEIPDAVLHPGAPTGDSPAAPRRVRIRPLTVRDVQLIARAARQDEVLTSALMIQRAVVEPTLREKDVVAMHGGLVRFLVDAINRASGLATEEDDLREMARSPLVQAFTILAREFGWTPAQVQRLTVGQIVGYLQTLQRAGEEQA